MRLRGTAFVLMILGLLAPLPAQAEPAAAASPAVATAARVGGDHRATRIVIDLNRVVSPEVFMLADPDRLVIDLPGVVFRAPPPEGGRGLARAYRFGLITRERSRLVVDLDGPAVVAATRTVAAVGDEPSRFVVELQPASRARFRQEVARTRPAARAELPRAQASGTFDERPLIVLDPGHGGIDPGTHAASGEQEKDVVLSFGQALRDRLVATGRYRVLMTRDDDSYLPLDDRVAFAREHQADLFVSLHADSLSWPYSADASVHGATVYTLSDRASDAEAARLAEEENRSDALAGVDLSREPDAVAGILIDLARRETHVFSLRFARAVLTAAPHALPLNKNPLRSAGFVVLKAPDVPSVLVELGYMSSQKDLKHLTAAAWRGRAAGALVDAVDAFFGPKLVAVDGRTN